jgi:NAD(P)-dependent dehydrogenase (short-subunit alcohol dehydrogenase family)
VRRPNGDVKERQVTDTTGTAPWLTGGQRGQGQAFARGLVEQGTAKVYAVDTPTP